MWNIQNKAYLDTRMLEHSYMTKEMCQMHAVTLLEVVRSAGWCVCVSRWLTQQAWGYMWRWQLSHKLSAKQRPNAACFHSPEIPRAHGLTETGVKAGQSRWEGSCCFLGTPALCGVMGKVWKLAVGTVAQHSECNESYCCCSLRNGSNGAWDMVEIFFCPSKNYIWPWWWMQFQFLGRDWGRGITNSRSSWAL